MPEKRQREFYLKMQVIKSHSRKESEEKEKYEEMAETAHEQLTEDDVGDRNLLFATALELNVLHDYSPMRNYGRNGRCKEDHSGE